ncbi:MAG: zinc-binding alcohol dehydrogenase family protein [Deltaproteobacteria bacterium]|nr:zinc-binding alcohol dehydrogenase family protein [Deltaproteobacteria bacterium]
MKAAVYYETGAPSVLRYEDVPDPVCGPGGVLIEVKAIGIEGGDLGNRNGGAMASRPHIVGYNCAGIVREVGEGVSDRKIGDRVTALMFYGSHAELASVAAAQTWLVPDGLSLEHAACVPVPWGTAHDCLFEFGHLQKGETVLIQAGASGVGLACVQLAKRAGATVFATASTAKLERLQALGVDHGIAYRDVDFVQAVSELTGGSGVNLVVDAVGGDTLQRSLLCLAYRGRAITVGNSSRGDLRIDPQPLMGGNRTLTGVFLGAELAFHTARVRAMLDDILRDLASGALQVIIDRTFPLAEAAAAHARAESRAAFGRVVMIP